MARILLKFSNEIMNKPITAQTILEEEVALNILSARINTKGGEILVEVPSDHAERTIQALRNKGVVVLVPKQIEVDGEKCVNCGACISLCPVEVITQNDDYSVAFNVEKCLGSTCGLCIDTCPMRAISLVK